MKALAIARFTLQEAVSRRLILAGLVLSLAFIGLFALGFSFIYGKAVEQTAARPAANDLLLALAATTQTVMGLYAVQFLTAFLALFLAVGAVSGEIDNGTLHAVLARPIRRSEFVFGRWLAYAGLVTAYAVLMGSAILLLARLMADYEPGDAPRALGLLALEGVFLLTLSLFGSTRLSTLANGVVVFSLFGLAWLASVVELVGDLLENEAMINLGIGVSLLVPSDALWRGASYYLQSSTFLAFSSARQMANPLFATTEPTAALIIWSGLYTMLLLAAAVASFARRDL